MCYIYQNMNVIISSIAFCIHITSSQLATNHMTSQHMTSPPRKHNQNHQTEPLKAGAHKNLVWASGWLVALRSHSIGKFFFDYFG